MATPRFYLKKPEPTGMALIYLQYKYNGKKLVYSFGQTINPDDWNPVKQVPKEKKATTTDGKYLLADTLETLSNECKKGYFELLPNGIPTPDMIKARLDQWMNKHFENKAVNEARPTFMDLVNRFVNGEMKIMKGKDRGKDKAVNTLKSYSTTKGHLERYQTKHKTKLDFENITLDWYMKFSTYLKSTGLEPNSIGKQIKNVKAFLDMANKLTFELDGKKHKYTTNKEYLDFGVHNEPGDDPYLSEAEIIRLYKFDLNHNKRLEAVRDLFIFGCWVGLRYSDYSNVKPQNIIDIEGERFITIKTKKTGAVVKIPCNPIVLEIFNKYENNPNKLPRTISGQKFNEYLKEAAQLAGLNELGRKPSKPDLPLFNCVTSHTARRSFATNYYLDGFPTIDLMKITGHKTEKSFLGYIRINELQAAKRMAEHNSRKDWNGMLSKVDAKVLRVAS